MKSCKDICEDAQAYVDGDLTFWHRARVRLHLFMCRNCTAFYDQTAKTRDLLRASLLRDPAQETVPVKDPSPDLLAELRRRRD